MKRIVTELKVTMINNSVWYVDPKVLYSGGVPETVSSYFGNQIKGSRGPMIRANAASDFTGEEQWLNPALIVSVKPTYGDAPES